MGVPQPAPESRPADPTPGETPSLAFLLDAEFDDEDDEFALAAARRLHRALLDEDGRWDME